MLNARELGGEIYARDTVMAKGDSTESFPQNSDDSAIKEPKQRAHCKMQVTYLTSTKSDVSKISRGPGRLLLR